MQRAQRKHNIMNENEFSKIVIGLAIDIHTALGPGLLESAYKESLFYKFYRHAELVSASFLPDRP